MSLKKIMLFLCLQLVLSNSWAKNYMSIMGAGGEPAGPNTIFDFHIKPLAKFTKKAKWKTELTFNGGHSNTENELSKEFGPLKIRNKKFTKENYNENIENYVQKILSGEIKQGDQILLYINSHGALKAENEDSHHITLSGGSITNFETGAGADTVSLDSLKQLTELAKAKNIKLGIVDFSCHSGSTLSLQNENTCVISATGPNHYAFGGNDPGTFSNTFVRNLKKGRSLEEVFLRSRDDFKDRSFPMISSPTGLALNEDLYDPLAPFLYYFRGENSKFAKFINDQANQAPQCNIPNRFQELLDIVNYTEKTYKKKRRSPFSSRDGKKLKSLLGEYSKLMTEQVNLIQNFNLPELEKEEEYCEIFKIGKREYPTCMKYSIDHITTLDVEWLRNFNEEQFKNDDKSDPYSFYSARQRIIDQLEQRKKELFIQYPDLANRGNNIFKNQKNLESQTLNLSYEISMVSKKLYRALYNEQAKKDRSPNPCKDFVL